DAIERMAAELREREDQLRGDEEAMQMQIREMEMTMAKERADLARQKAQLQRLQADLQHEIEMANRDPGLRDRLAQLQRGNSDSRPRTMAPLAAAASPPPQKRPSGMRPTTMPAVNEENTDTPHESKSVLRRLFGG